MEKSSDNALNEPFWSRTLVSLRYRNFRLLWLGSATEHVGEFMEIAGILWLANKLSHSPLVLAIVGSARFIPLIFFPVIGGVIADRVNRVRLLIFMLLSAGALSLILAVLTLTGAVTVWQLIVIGLLGGLAMSFNHPARHTILPNLIKKEHLLNAISLDSISVHGSRMVGMALAGYLITKVGLWPIFALRAAGCLLSVLWLRLADMPPTPINAREKTHLQNILEGFEYLRSNKIILMLVILYLIPWLAGNTLSNFLPIFAGEILNVGAVGYGYLQASPGFGSIISLAGLTLLTYYKGKHNLLAGSACVMGLSIIAFSNSINPYLSFALLVISGAMQTVFTAVNSTIIQEKVEDHIRGRVMSLREVAFGIGPSGSMVFGVVAQITGVKISLGILGLMTFMTAIGLIAYFACIKKYLLP